MSAILFSERTDPLALVAFEAGFTLEGVLAMRYSPIAFACDERWKPLLKRIEETWGYVTEWVPAPEDAEPQDWRPRWGMALLTYIG